VEAVRERGRGRLVDDAQDVEAGDLAGVLRRLALGVVEVRGHGDHRLRDRLAEISLGVCLELLEDHRADLRRGVLLALRLHGLVRPPSAFGMTVGSPPSSTAMHELVVPRSMPIVFAIWVVCLLLRKSESVYSRFLAAAARLGSAPCRRSCRGSISRIPPRSPT